MIYLGFALRNPFSRRFQLLKEWVVTVSLNTTIEVGFYKTSTIIGGSISVTSFVQDHRGFGFDLELLGYRFDFTYYDNRHSENYR